MKIKTTTFLVYFYMLMATIMLIFLNNLICFCIISLLLVALIIILFKIDIKNPLVLFISFFILYQISFPILQNKGFNFFGFEPIHEFYFIYSWIATISFILFYGNFNNIHYNKEMIYQKKSNVVILRIIYGLFAMISIIASFYIIKNGYNSKYDLAHSGIPLITVGTISYTILIIFPLFFFLTTNIKRFEKISIGIFNFLLLLFGVFTFGERSFLLNYMIVLLINYVSFYKLRFRKMAPIFMLCILIYSFSSSLKMILSSNRYISKSNNDYGIVVNFLNSNFPSAGYNFNYLLNHNQNSVLKGKSYIYDFLSPVDDIVPIGKYNPSKWYQSTFWKNRKTGVGFSLVGEGYANFGLLGIIIEMFLLARIIKFFYLLSNKNYYYYIINLGCLSLSLYACRQSLASIISPIFKYYILLAVIIYYVNRIHSKYSIRRVTNEKVDE